jgi:hypothetical protein
MPGFGAMTALCGGIMIKRGKKGTMQQCLEQSADRLGSGICVGLFPQGTRSVPSLGKPALEFKKGFVVMAAKAKTRIVPLTFLYAPDFLSSGRDMSTQGAKVIVHKPVSELISFVGGCGFRWMLFLSLLSSSGGSARRQRRNHRKSTKSGRGHHHGARPGADSSHRGFQRKQEGQVNVDEAKSQPVASCAQAQAHSYACALHNANF